MRSFFLTLLFTCSVLFVYGQKEDSSWRESYFSGEPLRIGNRTQFLFDDFIVEDKYGLKRVIGPVEKYSGNPLMGVGLRCIVFDPEDNLFKGWYHRKRWEPGFETGHNYYTLYAESKDGINWEKSKLDLFDIEGREPNIVLYKEKGTALLVEVILDTLAKDPARRYIGLVKMVPPGETKRCIVKTYSPDGKKWTLAPNPILIRGASDGSYSLVNDTEKNRWLIYRRPVTRALVNNKDDLGFYSHRNHKRRFSVSMSTDFKNWTRPRNIVIMDELDDSKVTQVGNNMGIDWTTVKKYKSIFLVFQP